MAWSSVQRFSAAGAATTAIGYAVIFGSLALGASPYLSNAAGYGIGLVCSFALNRAFVFGARGPAGRQAARFLGAFALAYAANLTVLHALVAVGVDAVAGQMASGVVYLVAMYGLCRHLVFREGGEAPNSLRV